MNRKQRRALAKQNRTTGKKAKALERKLGTDYEKVQTMAVTLESTKERMLTMQQAVEEIPEDELDIERFRTDLLGCRAELEGVRKSAAKMGDAVRQAIDEAIAASTDAANEIETALAARRNP